LVRPLSCRIVFSPARQAIAEGACYDVSVATLSRSELLNQALSSSGFDGVIAWRPEEIVMLCGVQPHLGATCCVWRAGATPVVLVPATEPPECRPQDCEIREFAWDGIEQGDRWSGMRRQIHELAQGHRICWKGHGAQSSPAGNAAESPGFPSNWTAGLPGEDSPKTIDALLARKTPADIERIRVAQRIAARGVRRFREWLTPGITEAELAAQVEAAIHSASGQSGVGLARAWATVQSGPNAAEAGRYSRSRGRRIAAGEGVILELATCVDGYWSDLTRTATAGGAGTELWNTALSAVRLARDRACSVIRPGCRASEVDAVARGFLYDAGFGAWFSHATGHPTGFRYHDPGPILAAECNEILETGMVLTVEPGIYGGPLPSGCRIEDNVVVTTTGSERLSSDEQIP
jgi:Xaa-Pro aminopeptidase